MLPPVPAVPYLIKKRYYICTLVSNVKRAFLSLQYTYQVTLGMLLCWNAVIVAAGSNPGTLKLFFSSMGNIQARHPSTLTPTTPMG